MAEPPIVTLLTDFGRQDPFVGIMKGVILTQCRRAQLVDLCHEIPPFDLLGASLQLRAAVESFPAGTIHLAVVDPGVGGSRRPLVACIDEQRFVAPDNGLLSHVLQGAPRWRAHAVTEPPWSRHPRSTTFHGRDLFAPAAGLLAAGEPLEAFGPEITDPVRLSLPRPTTDAHGVAGVIVWVDRFGNCLTSIDRPALTALAGQAPFPLAVSVGRRSLGPILHSFEAAGEGGVGALIGSTGHLELFANRGNLAERWGLAPGVEVRVEPGERGSAERAPAESREDLA
jgi:hypothetical protein